MEINDFLAISVVGVFLSLVIELVKKKFETQSWATKMITVVLSVVIAGGYIWIRSTPWFETVLTVLGAASIVYAFFLKSKPEESIM